MFLSKKKRKRLGSISEYPLCHLLAYTLRQYAVGGGNSEIAPTFVEKYVERSDKTHSVTFTRGQATPA